MLKKWKYQGQGLGPHEQGNTEPVIVNTHPRSHGLGYISDSLSPKGVGTIHPPSKHISKPTISSSHPSIKNFCAIPPPPSLQTRTTYHIPPSSSKSILGPYIPKSTIASPSHTKSILLSFILKFPLLQLLIRINKGTCQSTPSITILI